MAPHKGIGRNAYETIFRDHYSALVNFGMGYVHDRDTSEEIVQEVFLNLWQKRDEISPGGNIRSYLFTSVKNRCLNYLRDHRKFRSEILDLEVEAAAEEPDMLQQAETMQRVKDAMDKLPEKCREVFEYSRFEDMKYREIAEKLGISVKTVEAQMSKALKILSHELKDLIILIIAWLQLWKL
ncbi:MAG: RNA polymerase sigma-70 factor [Bacteroidales bacterium]